MPTIAHITSWLSQSSIGVLGGRRDRLAQPVSCIHCRESWERPKNVYISEHTKLPDHLKPSTQETLVAFKTDKVPLRLFQNIELTHSARSLYRGLEDQVVVEFAYRTDDGTITHDVSKQKNSDDSGYARLITTNSWYQALLKTIVYISFSVMDLQSNFMLVATLFSDPSLRRDIEPWLRAFFTAAWIFMLIVSLTVALRTAAKEYSLKASPATGDLIEHCCAFDRRAAYIAMVAFIFFSVEKQVKDIVIMLHPWKSVQPFAAFKTEGTRAFIVGYPDEYLFRVDNRPGQLRSLPAQLVTKSVVFALKLYMFIRFRPLSVGVSCLSSVGSLGMGWQRWVTLRRNRAELQRSLMATKEELDILWSDGHWDDAAHKQWQAVAKLLFLHFGQKLEKREKPEISPTSDGSLPTRSLSKNSGTGLIPAFSTVISNITPVSSTTLPNLVPGGFCPKCGRGIVQARPSYQETVEVLSKADLPVTVELSTDYRAFHDASCGYLKPGELGQLIERGPEHPVLGIRGLVETGKQEMWWYDLGALRLVEEGAGSALVHRCVSDYTARSSSSSSFGHHTSNLSDGSVKMLGTRPSIFSKASKSDVSLDSQDQFGTRPRTFSKASRSDVSLDSQEQFKMKVTSEFGSEVGLLLTQYRSLIRRMQSLDIHSQACCAEEFSAACRELGFWNKSALPQSARVLMTL
mmetsp:Transcript_15958/g.34955  ORF Transcript_15958/g.34955 Transcript_15958/m.34955 type:complete len:689 (+) Transcript_15958:79-2145(+)